MHLHGQKVSNQPPIRGATFDEVGMKIATFWKYLFSVLITGVFFLALDVVTGYKTDVTNVLIIAFAILWCEKQDKKP